MEPQPTRPLDGCVARTPPTIPRTCQDSLRQLIEISDDEDELAGESRHAIAELFSPPRLTQLACNHGLQPGLSFDLEQGVDLSDVNGRATVWAYLHAERPLCTVVSPPCTYFSSLMGMNNDKARMDRVQPGIGKRRIAPGFCNDGLQIST